MKDNKNNKPLRVAMIGQKRVPSREGGVEVVVWELASRYRDLGIEVDCYNRSGYTIVPRRDYERVPGKRGWYRDGIRIITVPTVSNGKLNAIVYSAFAAFRALFGGYDVIHFHAEGPCLMCWLPKLFGIRVVATIHGLDWQRAKWGHFASRMLKTGEKMAVRHADEVIVLSRNLQDYFWQEYGRKTHYIPNGVARPRRILPNEIKERWGLSKDGYIMTLCRIVPEKGLHYLLEAFKEVRTDKKLLLAGGPSNAREYYEEIERLAAEDERVILAGLVEGNQLAELLSNAYIFALPSDVEGMSVSLLEAMSYGNCCLISDIRESTEVVEEHAPTFPRGDAAALRTVLQDLIDHPEKVEGYRKESADYICSKYGWGDVVSETLQLYRTPDDC
jgi:glycosyltransferase involved in cell wall biosynthesis